MNEKRHRGRYFDHDGVFTVFDLAFCYQSVIIAIVNKTFKKGAEDMRSKSLKLMSEIQNYISQFILSASRKPSIDEIAKGVGISKGTAHNYLKEMDERQMISYQNGELRSRFTEKCRWEQVGMPISGVIPCGTPEEQVENVDEYVFLPRALVGSGEFFILRASGDSMVDAGIDSGDLVIIRRQPEALPGQIVAALVDGGSTLKRLEHDDDSDCYYLKPENSSMNYPPITGNIISIQGVAVQVLKSL